MAQGVVAKITEKEFPNGIAYSFTLTGDRTYYRLGNKKPTFAEGDSIRFTTSQKGQNSYASDVVSWKEDGVRTGSTSPAATVAKSSSGPRTSDEFWRNKELRDVLVQSRIELQSCRNSAIELVRILFSQGVEAVKLPAAQAKREQIVAEMVTKYTSDFLRENKAGGPGTVQEPAVADKSEAVEAANEVNKIDDWT